MKLSLCVLVLFLCSCTHENSQTHDETSIKLFKIEEYGTDFALPQKAWDQLLFKEEAKGTAHGGGHDAGKASESTLNTFFSEVSVEFQEKTPGVLKYHHFKIQFPKGGGSIDLNEYRTGAQGTFYVKFDFSKSDEANQKRVIYLSRGRKRRLENLIAGSGCNVFFDITQKFYENMKSHGIEVNTTRHRDVSLLSGHFLFYANVDSQNYISQVQFFDSKNKFLECEDDNESNPKN